MKYEHKDVVQGVSDGMFAFLVDRPISVVDPMIKAVADQVRGVVAEGFDNWLENNREELIARIADAISAAQLPKSDPE